MSEWISCPKCGALMIGITAGHICPLCGYKVPVQTITTTTGTSAEYVPVIRCKDCKHRPHKNKDGYIMPPRVQVGIYAWGEPEYDDDETCPYVCEDRWYSRIPSDEQYCDRAERKETEQ